ncbi:hypothetical protein NMY22_g3515 [Coprinellus aureogranulatus]|nr:hypothetical protein NMY22_g3515 [Coprinellus aureogranulatus]
MIARLDFRRRAEIAPKADSTRENDFHHGLLVAINSDQASPRPSSSLPSVLHCGYPRLAEAHRRGPIAPGSKQQQHDELPFTVSGSNTGYTTFLSRVTVGDFYDKDQLHLGAHNGLKG